MTPQDTFNLAICYYEGKEDKEQDYPKAYALFLEAAEAGHVEAQSYMGRMLSMGEGVKQNYEEAVKWLKIAAEAGEADAQNRLGVRCEHGEGIKKDTSLAKEWFRKAAENGHIKAMKNLAIMIRTDDKDEAYKWFTAAAEAGDSGAMRMLGLLYRQDKCFEDSIAWLQKAQDAGDTSAMYFLANIYLELNELNKAFKLYRKAAIKGSKKARRKLTDLYNGTRNVDVNIQEHLRLLYIWKDVHSLLSLAYFTMEGIGIKADAFEAVRLWKRIHQQGYKIANYNLAMAHYFGIGTDQNKTKAKEYLSEIIDYDHQAAIKLAEIESDNIEKPSFQIYSPDIIPGSILEAEVLTFSDKYASAEKIYKKAGTADAFFYLARYYKHEIDDATHNDLLKSNKYFEKALKLGHPYATYIKSRYKKDDVTYEDYDLYSPYFLNDIVDYCFPDDIDHTVWDLVYVFWNIIKGNESLVDIPEFTDFLNGKLNNSNGAKEGRAQLFSLCKLKNNDSFIEECKEYIWDTIEKGKESTLLFPSKSFIDAVNSQLIDSQSICFYKRVSLKFIKFLDKDKRYNYYAINDSTYIMAHFLVDLMDVKNIHIKHDTDELEECDTVVMFPNLSIRNNHENTVRQRVLSMKKYIRLVLGQSAETGSEIGSSISNTSQHVIRRKKDSSTIGAKSDVKACNLQEKSVRILKVSEYKADKTTRKFSKALILTNRDFVSSVLTDLSGLRGRLLRSQHLKRAIEFPKEMFSDIETTTTLLSLDIDKKYGNINLVKDNIELTVDYETLKHNNGVLSYDIYTKHEEDNEEMMTVMLSDIMVFRTEWDKKRKENKVRMLRNSDFQSTLLNAVTKSNKFTQLKDTPPSGILKEYKGEHIFLKYNDGVCINIQTDKTYCCPDYGTYAIARKKNSPVTLKYLAYILLSEEINNHMARIVDKDGLFMVRDMMYKRISIHKSESKQKEIVEKALLDERMRIVESLEYKIVVLSENADILDLINNEVGFSCHTSEKNYDEICKKYITNSSSGLIDAIIIDTESDDYQDLLEDFNEIQQKGIHIYIVTSDKDIQIHGKKKSAYFRDEKRIFTLNTDETDKALIRKMRDDLNSTNAAQAKIRKQYKDVFDAADALDAEYPYIGISAAVLRYIQTGCVIQDDEQTSGPCATFRGVCHELLKVFIKEDLVPSMDSGAIPSLLKTGTYYDSTNHKQYLLIEPFMSKSLSQSLEYFCKITNSAVHRSQNSSKLGTAALNILMEFIVWFHENINILKEIPKGDERRTRGVDTALLNQKGKVYTIKECKNGEDRFFYAENIHFVSDGTCDLRDGMTVEVTSAKLSCEMIGEREYSRKRVNGNPIIYYAKCKEYK